MRSQIAGHLIGWRQLCWRDSYVLSYVFHGTTDGHSGITAIKKEMSLFASVNYSTYFAFFKSAFTQL